MPVIVVGAASPFGYQLVDALIATGGQVRVFLHAPDPILEGKRVHRALGGPVDVERLEAACAQVHTLIHLTAPFAERSLADEAEALEVTAISAHAADVARVVLVHPEPLTGRRGRRIAEGFTFLEGRSFEVIHVPVAASVPSGEAIRQILDADERPEA